MVIFPLMEEDTTNIVCMQYLHTTCIPFKLNFISINYNKHCY